MLVTAVFRPTLNIVGSILNSDCPVASFAQIDSERKPLWIQQRQQRARSGDFDFHFGRRMIHDHHPLRQRAIADRHGELFDRSALAGVDEYPESDRERHRKDAQTDIAAAQTPRTACREHILEVAQLHRASSRRSSRFPAANPAASSAWTKPRPVRVLGSVHRRARAKFVPLSSDTTSTTASLSSLMPDRSAMTRAERQADVGIL